MAEPDPNERFLRMQALFNEALTLPDAKRDAWLIAQCGEDVDLLAQTRTLLQADESERSLSETLALQQTQAPIERRRLGPYEIQSLLGRGGMGAVYLAQRADGQYERQVAIKLVDLPLATEVFFERFRQERQILAGLDHPGIARMLDGGVSDDGILYLVMEYVNGVPVDEYIRLHRPPLEVRLKLFIKVCKAVQFAHQSLVIHRDLKPDNILVTPDGEPHLLDFGTATLLSPNRAADTQGLTRQGFLSFTPAYASPEQVLGRPITTATDTYSLGVLLYLLLTGHLPYQLNDYTTEEMVDVICEKAPTPPTSEDGTFPNADLEAVLSKALRKEPEQRYQTAEQLAADVEAYLEHRPVSARKGTLQYTVIKFVRRNRLGLSLAALLLVAVIGGIIGVAWQAHLARLAERKAVARSNDLLGLSDSLLSELDSTIAQLPGSTGAQQLLVNRVLEHLESLPAEARADKRTAITLSNAYVRLASLQGDPYEQNIGDLAGAKRSMDKALAILRPALTQSPDDPTLLHAMAKTQNARGEILSMTQYGEAVDSLKASEQIYSRLLKLPNPTAHMYAEAASVDDTMGDILGQDTGFSDLPAAAAQYQKSMAIDREALAADPTSIAAKRGLVLIQMKLGNVDLDLAPEVALAEFRKAIGMLEALSPTEQERLSNRRLRGLLLRKQAAAFAELCHYTEADKLFAAAHEIYGSISAADPKDLRAKRDLALMLYVELDAAERAADPMLAEPGYDRRHAWQRAADLAKQRLLFLRELHEAKPADDTLKLEIAMTQVRLATNQARLNGALLSRDTIAEPLSLLKASVDDPASTTETLELAYIAYASLPSPTPADLALLLHIAERSTEMTHHRSPDWMLSLAQSYEKTGDPARAKQAAQGGLALLPAPSPEGHSFYVRKLLESIASR